MYTNYIVYVQRQLGKETETNEFHEQQAPMVEQRQIVRLEINAETNVAHGTIQCLR